VVFCLKKKNLSASKKPIVEYAPALILRKRSTKGFLETLKRIKEQIEDDNIIPREFLDLAEIQANFGSESEGDDSVEQRSNFDGEIFYICCI